MRERVLELGDGHLMNWFRTAGHDVSSFVGGYCHV
jgi:hypothetical protein